MKKKILLILALIFLAAPSYSADEIVLEIPEEETEVVQDAVASEYGLGEERTLRDKLRDVYHLEVEKYDKPNYLLSEVLTKHFDDSSIFDRTHL